MRFWLTKGAFMEVINYLHQNLISRLWFSCRCIDSYKETKLITYFKHFFSWLSKYHTLNFTITWWLLISHFPALLKLLVSSLNLRMSILHTCLRWSCPVLWLSTNPIGWGSPNIHLQSSLIPETWSSQYDCLDIISTSKSNRI